MRILVHCHMTTDYTWSIIAMLLLPDLSSLLTTEESSENRLLTSGSEESSDSRESSITEAATEAFSLAVLNLFLELLKV